MSPPCAGSPNSDDFELSAGLGDSPDVPNARKCAESTNSDVPIEQYVFGEAVGFTDSPPFAYRSVRILILQHYTKDYNI